MSVLDLNEPIFRFLNEPSEETPLSAENLNNILIDLQVYLNRKAEVSSYGSILNCNEQVFSGFYNITSRTTNLPVGVVAPSSSKTSPLYLIVFANADTLTTGSYKYYAQSGVTQILLDNSTNKIYTRKGVRNPNIDVRPVTYSGTFDDWQEITRDVPNLKVGTISKAGYKWQEKEVYVKQVDCGFAPNNSTKNISSGLNTNTGEVSIVKIDGIAYREAEKTYDYVYPLPYHDTGTNSIGVFVNGDTNSISIRTESDRSKIHCYVNLYFVYN